MAPRWSRRGLGRSGVSWVRLGSLRKLGDFGGSLVAQTICPKTLPDQSALVQVCGFQPVSASSCPCSPNDFTGCDLPECVTGMVAGQMCEADNILPDGTADYNIDNCPGGYDVWVYCPPPTPAPPPTQVLASTCYDRVRVINKQSQCQIQAHM